MSPVPANNRDITKEDDESDISASNAPQFAIDNSDSDSDGGEEEADGYQGYQLLPQDPDGVSQGQEQEEAVPVEDNPPVAAPSPPSAVDQVIMQSLDNQDMMNAVAAQGPAEDEIEPSERAEVWNSPPPASAASIPMDADHVEKIRSAMSGFLLPPAAQPAWAGQLSDDDWKQFLKLQASSMTLNSAKPQRSQNKNSKEKTVDR